MTFVAKRSYHKAYKDFSELEKARSRRNSLASWHRNKHRRIHSGARLRREMLQMYGDICRCCGEYRPEFLQIDHVNGGGRAHRQMVGGTTGVMRDLKRQGWPQNGYRLLCANCNVATMNGRKCPHEAEQCLKTG